MKRTLIGVLFFSSLFSCLPFLAFAQQTSTAPTQPVLVATVNIYGAKIVSQQGSAFTISFKLSNRQNAQPGVKYAVELLDSKQNVIAEDVYPDVLNLNANSDTPLTITYNAPAYLTGTYQMMVLSSNTNGLPLAQASLGSVKLSGSGANVAIQPSTCYLQISGAQTKYSPDQGIDIAQSESLSLTCVVQNTAQSALTLVPSFETFYRNAFGNQVQAEVPTEPSISIAAGATQNVTVALPKPSDPQAYDVQVSFTDAENVPSNSVIAHFVVDGPSATIENVTLDQTSYEAGDTAKVTLFWTGVANNFPGARNAPTQLQGTQASVSIVDGSGSPCGQSISTTLNTMDPQQVIPFPITMACDSPTVHVTLSDSSGVLASSSFNFTGPASTSSQSIVMSPEQSANSDLWTIIIGLIILVVGGYIVLRWRKPKLPDSAAMIIFLMLGSALVAGALPQQARADTFTQNVYLDSAGHWSGWFTVDYTANLDNDTYAPGATITATGNADVGTCANSLYADVEATVNGQTQELTSNYLYFNGWDDAYGIQSTPQTFTAQTTPGSYNADFYEQIGGSTVSAGAGSFFCLPAGTQGTFSLGGTFMGGVGSCYDISDGSWSPVPDVTPPATSFTASDPYLIPYTVTGSSGTCPDGSAAPNSDPNQCTCAQGNQNACNGTCPTGYTYQSDQCVPSGGNCPIGYAYESGQCVFTSCPSGYVLQSGQCVYADQCTQGLYCSDGNLYNQTIQGGACVGTLDQQCPYGCDSDTLSCNPPPTPQFEQFDAIGPDGSVFTSDGSLTALPTLLPAGLTSNLYWNAEYVEPGSCKVTGTNGDSFLGTDSNVSEGNTNTSGASGVKTGPITSQTIYTLECTGYDGSSLGSTTTINVVPMFNEF